jgi:hypothetical protein
LLDELAPYRPYFAEAPCAPEDITGLAEVAARSPVPIAAGEEWRSTYEALARFERRALSIIQPEMGHTGVSEFMAIGRLAQAFHARVIPHAAIGVGFTGGQPACLSRARGRAVSRIPAFRLRQESAVRADDNALRAGLLYAARREWARRRTETGALAIRAAGPLVIDCACSGCLFGDHLRITPEISEATARVWEERTAGNDPDASDDIEWAALLRLVDRLYPDYRT